MNDQHKNTLPREFWLHKKGAGTANPDYQSIKPDGAVEDFYHVIEVSAITDLSVKLQRTVNAAYHALLEMSAWMGIPEKKRHTWIEEAMSNVKYCAEHDLRHIDESQAVNDLRHKNEALVKALKKIAVDPSSESTPTQGLYESRECARAALKETGE